ncbi:unnamed protein product, partial [Ectocarpus fasciculatus]
APKILHHRSPSSKRSPISLRCARARSFPARRGRRCRPRQMSTWKRYHSRRGGEGCALGTRRGHTAVDSSALK